MIYEIKNLNFAYSEKNVLKELNLEVNEGEIVTILGRNGAGKSTLLNCMLGLLKPQSGTILLEGKELFKMNEREISSIVGYVPQIHVASFGFSVMEFVIMGCASRIGLFSKPGKREHKYAETSLKELGIEHLADKPYTEISGGERQKAVIARAIVSNPRVVLFDEPTAHLDYGSQLLVLRIIKKLSIKGYSIVITTHNPDHAFLLGGKAALIDDNGVLISGKVEEIVTQKNLSSIYQADVRLEYIKNVGRMSCVYSNL